MPLKHIFYIYPVKTLSRSYIFQAPLTVWHSFCIHWNYQSQMMCSFTGAVCIHNLCLLIKHNLLEELSRSGNICGRQTMSIILLRILMENVKGIFNYSLLPFPPRNEKNGYNHIFKKLGRKSRFQSILNIKVEITGQEHCYSHCWPLSYISDYRMWQWYH